MTRSGVLPVIRLVDVFGFHGAVLNIRQNSAFHDRALAQLQLTRWSLDPDQVAAQANVRWQIFKRFHGYSVGRIAGVAHAAGHSSGLRTTG